MVLRVLRRKVVREKPLKQPTRPNRVIRGGYWNDPRPTVAVLITHSSTPSNRRYYDGFRCVRVW